MYNKLSFIPFESLYPVRLALDDYEDDGQNGPVEPKKDTIKLNNAFGRSIYLLAKLLDGTMLETEVLRLCEENLRSYEIPINEEDIISQFDKKYIPKLLSCGEERIGLEFLQKVSIYLVSEDKIPQKPHIKELSTDWLGYYYSKDFKIVLCPSRIERIAKNHKIDLKIIYAIVLIHELAHAMMDSTNKLENIEKDKETGELELSSKDLAMEESLANMITLQYFKAAKDKGLIKEKDFEQVRNFMQKQPAEYKFGIAQEEIIKPDWRSWRDNKSTIKYWTEWGAKVEPYLSELEKNYPDFFDMR